MADSTVVNLERRGTRTRGEQTRQKILDATLQVIAREGVRGTTHRAIASEAGVQFSPDDLADSVTRGRIIDYCTKRIVDHVWYGLTEYPEGLAVEHHFFFEGINDPDLQELSKLHRRRLLRPVISFCEYFNTTDPETDANLLFGTITRLEYEALTSAPDNVDYRSIRNEIRRIIGWIVKAD